MLRVCRAVLGPADADDAWSETFLAALRAYPDLPATRTSRRGWSRSRTARRSTCSAPAHGSRSRRRGPRPARRARHARRHDLDLWEAVRRCPPSSGRPSPTTTSPACPTPRSPPSSAAPPTPPAAPPPTASRTCARTYPARTSKEPVTFSPTTAASPTTPAAPPAARSPAAAPRGPARRRLPHRRLPGRPAAARRAPERPGPGRLRRRGPRRRAADARASRSARGSCARPTARRGGPGARRVLRRPAPPSTCRSTCGCRAGSAGRCCTTCPTIGYGQHRQLRAVAELVGQPERGPRGRHRLRHQPAAGRRALPPGGALRRDTGGYVGGPDAKLTLLNLEAAA